MGTAAPPLWHRDRVIRAIVLAQVAAVASIVAINLSPLLRSFTVDALFNLNNEASVPAWLSSATLLAIAALAAGCAMQATARRDRADVLGWGLIATAFTVLSLDETSMIHEHAGIAFAAHVGELTALPGVFMWVVVVAPIGLAAALAMGYWFLHMPRSADGEMRLAMAALGVWLTIPVIEALDPLLGKPWALIVLEESTEFVGETLMLWAMLLAHRHAHTMTARAQRQHDAAAPLRAAA